MCNQLISLVDFWGYPMLGQAHLGVTQTWRKHEPGHSGGVSPKTNTHTHTHICIRGLPYWASAIWLISTSINQTSKLPAPASEAHQSRAHPPPESHRTCIRRSASWGDVSWAGDARCSMEHRARRSWFQQISTDPKNALVLLRSIEYC